ncbi:TniQ family protein [Streptomyces sp. NPDC088726]|uniref:TniQ family protein n=1 Tax=Streptomyces sp. NPDC088726 TaxID=3365874 RepID=UPI0037F985AC
MAAGTHGRQEIGASLPRAPRPVAVPRVRRLPVVPKPVRGEAFASWVDRVAAKLDVPAGQAAHALGLECRSGTSTTRPKFFGITLTPASLGGLRDATGLPVRELQQMQLARYGRTVLDLTGLDLARKASLRAVTAREWMMPTWSRACPACLAESPVWPLWWRLGIAAVCPVHRCLLIDVCPACEVRLLRGNERIPRGLLTRPPLPEPGECANRPPHGPKGRAGLCRQPLAAIPTVAVPGPLVALQRRVLAIAEGSPATLAGEPVRTAAWFTALRYLTALARLTAGEDDFAVLPGFAAEEFIQDRQRRTDRPRGGGGSQLVAMPATAAQTLAALALTAPVLDASSTDVGVNLLAPWAESLTTLRRALGRTDPLRHTARPAVLDRMVAAVAPRPSRVAGALVATGTRDLTPRHIPHLADRDDYRELMATHLPGTAEASGRRLTALAQARLAGAASWAEAAAVLDMDARRATRAANTLVQRITDPDGFWKAARTAAERMQERGLVDDAARRSALADLREIPHRDLVSVFHPLGRDVTWQRQRHAAAWVWQHFTSGDVREAPAYALGWENETSTESIREGWRRFHTRLPAPAADALTVWGTARLAQKGTQ